MKDRYGREIEYMRVSITDRCNLRCKYCMPNGIEQIPMSRILTYEEILDICEAGAELGIRKIKVTGGEPLVRLGCVDFVRRLKAVSGIDQVTMTSNGILFSRYLPELLEAGLDAVNLSLDTLEPDRFREITGGGELPKVLRSIDDSIAAGLRTKVNCVLQRGFNDGEILDFAEMAFRKGIDVRFIELMPIGFGDKERGISNDEVLRLLREVYPSIESDEAVHGNGPAVYYRVPGERGAIGFISAIHGVFCASCNRIRLTSQGQIKPCLCYETAYDLRPALAEGKEALREALRTAISGKPDQHCFNDNSADVERKAMSAIGG